MNMRNWDLREFRVQVHLLSPIQQVQVPIRPVVTAIQSLPNPIWPVVPLISHIRVYTPHHSRHIPHLSLSRPQLHHYCRAQCYVIPLSLSMSLT